MYFLVNAMFNMFLAIFNFTMCPCTRGSRQNAPYISCNHPHSPKSDFSQLHHNAIMRSHMHLKTH